MNYGAVQRVLGISIRDLNSVLAKINIDRANGVYVDALIDNGSAKEAGIRAKDISIDNAETITASKLQEIISRKRPGDKVKIMVIRNGKDKKELTATLKIYRNYHCCSKTNLLKELGWNLQKSTKTIRKNTMLEMD
jgi:S1-C subfamily serine protease